MRKYFVNPNQKKSKISKHIYGHFSEHLGRCIYEGIWVGEDSNIPNNKGIRTDVVEALKAINIPVLRWPGGCFADEYHWKDGIGTDRKRMINTHWGGVVEDNSFGTHEFMELCKQLECEPYICGNVGSGTVREMSEWVEYMTFDGVSPMAGLREQHGQKEPWALKYFGVGNENWGCGGNMRPEYYADEYRRYQTYVRNYGDNKIYRIAGGANVADYRWTEVLMERAHWLMDGLSLHYYVHPGGWENKGSATQFDEKEYYCTMKLAIKMDELVTKHSRIMDKYDPEKRVGLIVDEWGSWYDVEPGTNPGFLFQQNTMRDALIAGITLNIFNKHSDRVHMATLAQMVNVLQAVLFTEGEKMLLTPTYHVMNMYKGHQEAELVESYIETSTIGIDEEQVQDIMESASIDEQGNVLLTLCNLDLKEEKEIQIHLSDMKVSQVIAEVLTGEVHDMNTFEAPEKVKVEPLGDLKVTDGIITVKLPTCSVASLKLC